jgi:hydroxyacylglutathione hydrolase
MPQKITPITLSLPFRMGTVNCYLLEAGQRYVLIDSGSSSSRARLENELGRAGCSPDNLALLVLTHGDFDHTGNASYLRSKFGARIAMHADDLGMAERGDMFYNRKSGGALFRRIAPILFGFSKANQFEPDLLVRDGDDLSAHGLDARIVHIPGHSKGSLGVLTAEGDLFCGDLLENRTGPALGSIMDDRTTAVASVERLRGLTIRTVYPGHGEPFAMSAGPTARDMKEKP